LDPAALAVEPAYLLDTYAVGSDDVSDPVPFASTHRYVQELPWTMWEAAPSMALVT
jgi:hypothetical protein